MQRSCRATLDPGSSLRSVRDDMRGVSGGAAFPNAVTAELAERPVPLHIRQFHTQSLPNPLTARSRTLYEQLSPGEVCPETPPACRRALLRPDPFHRTVQKKVLIQIDFSGATPAFPPATGCLQRQEAPINQTPRGFDGQRGARTLADVAWLGTPNRGYAPCQSAQQNVQRRLELLDETTLHFCPYIRPILYPRMYMRRSLSHRLRPIFVSGNPAGEARRLTHIHSAPLMT